MSRSIIIKFLILACIAISYQSEVLAQKKGIQYGDPGNKSISIVKSGNKYGVLDTNTDTLVLDTLFMNVYISKDKSFILAQKEKAPCYLYSTSGTLLSNYPVNFSKKIYEYPEPFLLSTYEIDVSDPRKAKCGYIDTKGNIIVDFEYDYCHFFRQGVAMVQKNGLQGLVDYKGNIIIQPIYYSLYGFLHDSIARVQEKDTNKWGIINIKGDTIIPLIYDMISDFKDSLAKVENRTTKKSGFINMNGDTIIPIIYDEISDFQNRTAVACVNDHCTLINMKGERILQQDYNSMVLSGSYYFVSINGRYGLLDLSGTEILPCKYDLNPNKIPFNIYRGLIQATLNGKKGLLNIKGETVIPFDYDEAKVLITPHIRVLKDGKYGLFNEAGKLLIPAKYDNIKSLSFYKYKATIGDKEEIFNFE